MIFARTVSGVSRRLASCPGIANLPDSFKAFFARWILCEMDQAIRRAAPSPLRPFYSQESWACVALDSDFTWIDPMWSGEEWRGHVMMFEMPTIRLARRERRALEETIAQIRQSLPNLSREQRAGTVQMAMDGMQHLTL